MDYKKIIKFLTNEGHKPCVDASYYNLVRTWDDWYRGYFEPFHKVVGTNGLVATARRMNSMDMAKKVCEDWASSLLNEEARIVVDSGTNTKTDKSSVFVQGSKGEGGVLGSNSFMTSMNELVERSFALGTGAVVLTLKDILIDEETGKVSADEFSRIGINYLDAYSIIPIRTENRAIVDCAFVSESKSGADSTYTIQVHKLVDGQYVLKKYILDSKYIKKYGTDVEVILTGSPNPLFQIIRPAIVNNKSESINNPMGISVFGNAIACLMNVDMAFDAYNVEIYNGKMKLFMDSAMLPRDASNNPIPPTADGNCLYQVFGDGESIQTNEFVKEFAPDLRVDALHVALQDSLNSLSFKVGLGNHYYNFEATGGITATEYVGEQDDFVRNCKKHGNLLALVIKNTVSEILWLGKNIFNANVVENAKVNVTCTDGFVEDDETLKKSDREEVAMGIMSKAEYRAKWYNESLESAKAILMGIENGQTGIEIKNN